MAMFRHAQSIGSIARYPGAKHLAICASAPPTCRAVFDRAAMGSIAFFHRRVRSFAEFVLLGEQILWIVGALARGLHMIELWHKWYGTLASVEALAAVVVIAVVSAGILTLVESQRHRTKH